MDQPTPLRPEYDQDSESNQLEALLLLRPLDYRCDYALYETIDGQHGIATIDRDAWGGITVRRILPGRHDETSGLRNWLEVATFLDVRTLSTSWRRNLEEEERRRMADRHQIGG